MRLAHPNQKLSPPAPDRIHICPICGDAVGKSRYPAREMVHGTREPFDYLLCKTCGTLYLADIPADISPYYQNYYSTGALAESSPTAKSLTSEEKILCREALRHPSPDSSAVLNRLLGVPIHFGFQSLYPLGLHARSAILDVGCGNGHIVEALDRIGFRNVTGCDPFLPHETTFPGGCRLIKQYLSDLTGQWDLIMMHHSFEHVPDPAATAKRIDERLLPDGRCLLRFPNVDSIEFARYGANWWGIHAPRHYHLLSRKALELVFADTGLKIESVWCDSRYDHYLYSYEYSLDISDADRTSVRQAGISKERWPEIEIEHIKRNVDWYNQQLIGDWIVYLLRKEA